MEKYKNMKVAEISGDTSCINFCFVPTEETLEMLREEIQIDKDWYIEEGDINHEYVYINIGRGSKGNYEVYYSYNNCLDLYPILSKNNYNLFKQVVIESLICPKEIYNNWDLFDDRLESIKFNNEKKEGKI